jgi:hypothetical protein
MGGQTGLNLAKALSEVGEVAAFCLEDVDQKVLLVSVPPDHLLQQLC